MPAEESMIASYQLDITVDHNQFFLEDCDDEERIENLDITWSTDTWYDEDALARHLGVTPARSASLPRDGTESCAWK